MKQKVMFLWTILVCLIGLLAINVQAQSICTNENGIHDGYYYELWNDRHGKACMTFKAGGTFSCQWSGINNVMFRKGLTFDHVPFQNVGNITVSYGAVFQPDGTSYLAVHGWFTNPNVEYYIVENWGAWRPPGASPIGTIDVDCGTYEVYRVVKSGPIDPEPLVRYWSVRTSKRTSGTISVSKHFNKWASLDLPVGRLYQVTFLVEGYQSNGQADVYQMLINIDSDDDYTEITTPFVQNSYGGFQRKTASIFQSE